MVSKRSSSLSSDVYLSSFQIGAFQLISDQLCDPVLIFDLQGYVVYANRAAHRAVEKYFPSITGKHFNELVHDGVQLIAKGAFKNIKKGVNMIRDVADIRTRGGRQIPIEYTITPIKVSNKLKLIHVIIRDMSDRIEFETLQRETEKMKALQQFIHGTTQEIKAPIGKLHHSCRYLLDKFENRSFEYIGFKEFKEMVSMLGIIGAQAEHSLNTVDRLIEINKKKAGLKQNHCDGNQVVREAIKILRSALEISNINILLKLNAKLPHVAIGALELNQVVVNVLNNAIQAIPGGGKIEIKTTRDESSQRICFEFKDNGIGIPSDSLSRIFEPFFTTKPKGVEKSTGLGLSIVYSIVKSYRGDIIIKSSLRQGTSVKIFLPVTTLSKSKK